MNNNFFPVANPAGPEVDELDLPGDADGIIDKLINGMTEEYALKCRPPKERGRPAKTGEKVAGDKLGKLDIIGIQLNGRNCHGCMSALYDDIDKEKNDLIAVSPGDYKTAASYKAALGQVANHFNAEDWYEGMKEANNVSTFSALKDLFNLKRSPE